MKLSVYLSSLLVVGVIFFVFATMIDESNSALGTDINNSAWKNQYDYVTSINSTLSPIEAKLKTIDQDDSWFSRLTAGITAIPYAVITFVVGIFTGFSVGGAIATGFLTMFGFPAYIITVVIMIIISWGVAKLIELLYRWYV